MSELKVCRICLRTEIKVYHFNQYLLKNYYEEIMAYQIEDTDSLPQYFCYECAAMLHKFHKFKEKCCNSQRILKEMSWKGNITYELISEIDSKNLIINTSLTKITGNRHIKTYIFKDSNEYVNDVENSISKEELDSFSETSLIDNVENVCENDCELYIDVKKDTKKNNKCHLFNKEKVKIKKNKPYKRKLNNEKSNITNINKVINDEIGTNIDEKHIEIVKENITNDEMKIVNEDNNISSPTVYVECKNISNVEINDSNNSDKVNNSVKKVLALQNTDNWKITVLNEEEALKDFKAKGENKKYLDAAYKCTDCFKGFSKKEMLERHIQSRHIEQLGKYVCHFCHYRYKQDCFRNRHIKQHYYRYTCLRCDLLCTLETTAVIHEEYHSGVIRKCRHCNEEFRHSSTYYTHLRTHRSEHVCTLCGASFVSSLGLHQHKIRKHVILDIESPDDDEDVNTYCERCEMRFETRKAYEEHLFHSALHSDEDGKGGVKLESESNGASDKVSPHKKLLGKREKIKITKELNKRKTIDDPFSVYMPRKRCKRKERRQRTKPTTCHQCGMHFETQAACLKHHMQAHPRTSFCPPNQRYICEICGASLAPGSVATHQNIHTREKLHTCDTCGKQFHSNIGLRRHLVTHTGEKPFACPLCDKRFTQSNSMKLHYNTFHLKQPYPKRNRQRKTEPKQSGEAENSGTDGSSDESLHNPPRDSGIEPVVSQRTDDNMHYLTLT